MVQQITQGIKISVKTHFQGSVVKDGLVQYAFSYIIQIENQSKDTVQLTSRFWKIKDSLNHPIIVKGEGVVGEKPILLPGEQHSYSSGCLLLSSIGAMSGYYNLMNFTTGRDFKVSIPLFKLTADFAMS